ncbi:BrnT family toxin [Allorhizobium undicola]|uniref:BrnT family toxin n=1 Tax=Allorhizobium undicola TaxID=78527 RepID=UPI003D33205B
MDLEWDEEKRQRNLKQRGLDFADVAWFEPESVITLRDERADYGEPRFNSYGLLRGVPCCFCWTPRNGRIRIISLRKINDRERKIYEARRKATESSSHT